MKLSQQTLNCYTLFIYLLLLSLNVFSAEFPVNVELKSYSELVNDEAKLKNYLYFRTLRDTKDEEYRYWKFDIGLHADKKYKNLLENKCLDVQPVFDFNTGKYIENENPPLIFSERCIPLAPKEVITKIYNSLIADFDENSPSYAVTISEENLARLNQEPYIKFIHRTPLVFDKIADAKIILPSKVADRLWVTTQKNKEANCLGTALATIKENQEPNYVWPPKDFFFDNVIELNEKDEIQLGDIFAFEIPGDGHFFTYIGTDIDTHEKMVFTKNNAAPGPFQFMKYSDVYKFYHSPNIVKRYRSRELSNFSPAVK